MSSSVLDLYVKSAPSAQVAVDIFKGEWASKFPAQLQNCEAGGAELFEDARISWFLEQCGGLQGRRVLELGPLEAGHTYMLDRAGARSIVAVESNTRAFLKCLVTKEMLGMPAASFQCGDFIEYLKKNSAEEFDAVVASGVLYHMRNPVELLALISDAANQILLWTHYYDEAIMASREELKVRFSGSKQVVQDGFAHTLHRYEYQTALDFGGFCGGSANHAQWMTRDGILDCLRHFGYEDLRISFDHPQHQNGPAFAVYAAREPGKKPARRVVSEDASTAAQTEESLVMPEAAAPDAGQEPPQPTTLPDGKKPSVFRHLFHKAWYEGRNADVADSGMKALEHYRKVGWKRGSAPHPQFDPSWYLQNNPDVADAGMEPLEHYLKTGWKEGRNPNPYFDVKWYLAKYPDVDAADVEPLGHYIEHGWRETRVPHPQVKRNEYAVQFPDIVRGQPFDAEGASLPRIATRTEKLLTRVRKSDKILELGPSYNPTVTRAEGWNCYSLDHGTGEELRQKYSTHANVDTSRIQDVDFVWRGGPLESAISPEHLGTFDVFIASHVIEHTPDLIAFFRSVSKILKPGGILTLAVPDKRFCFDAFQPVTLTGDVLEADTEKRDRHSKKALYNGAAYTVKMSGSIAWGQQPTENLVLVHPEGCGTAWKIYQEYRPDSAKEYVDTHTWYFTPSSFRLICLELSLLGLIDFQEVCVYESVGCEFHITLRHSVEKLSAGAMERRMPLLKKILMEIHEQAENLQKGESAGQSTGSAP